MDHFLEGRDVRVRNRNAVFAQLFPRAGEDRADRVHGDVQLGADLFVGPALQVVEADDFALFAADAAEEHFHLFEAFHALLGRFAVVDEQVRIGRRLDVPLADRISDARAAVEFVDADAARDHRQVRAEARVALELPQHFVVVRDDLEEYFPRDVFHVFGVHLGAADVRGEVDGVVDEAEEAVHEIVPRPRHLGQAALEQLFIDGCQRHGTGPGWGRLDP